MFVLVEAKFANPVASVTTPAGIEATTVPDPAMPVTVTTYAGPDPEMTADSSPPTVLPVRSMSARSEPKTGSLN